ncbi:LysR substrate-binding domain-containing protein [Vibrio tapetis]|uniref:Transcriptional activator n=1 Tax=Vibrio tapetis subsp. tapetis TaxID=1671868 RepID=A0A2N8ZK74_9VIBR|nr:LysR substrate-binding domain-containing protein [Vibrio tapetis]SON52305.1 Transcriptional activator [Vibrio tapetis subsp. tapetis]
MRHLPPLNSLRAFEAAARLNSLTLAAEELSVTRAAVSQQVKQLEHFLSAKLFERVGAKLRLTEEAQFYLPLLTHTFDALANGTDHLFTRQNRQTLTLRVANSFAQQWLLPRLDDFLRRQPNIDIKIHTTTHPYPQQNDGVDIEIINGYGPFEQVNAKPLWQENWLAVASPNWLQKQGWQDASLEAVAQSKKLAIFGYQESWQSWFDAQGYANKVSSPYLQLEHSMLAIEAAKQSLGPLLVRSLLVENELKEGDLVLLHSYAMPSKSQHYLITNHQAQSHNQRENVAAFSQWLQSCI